MAQSHDPLPKGSLTLAQLIAMFEPTLGREKSDEIVRGAAGELGLSGDLLAKGDVLALVERLGTRAGMTGLAARFVQARYVRTVGASLRAPALNAGPTAESLNPVTPLRVVPSARATSRDALVELLAPTLGREKSAELVEGAARTLHIASERINRDQALQILEHLGSTPGFVGVAASFAKARALLLFG